MGISVAVLSQGGFFVPELEASLLETLERVRSLDTAEVPPGEWTVSDLVRLVATTPPFNDALVRRIQLVLRSDRN